MQTTNVSTPSVFLHVKHLVCVWMFLTGCLTVLTTFQYLIILFKTSQIKLGMCVLWVTCFLLECPYPFSMEMPALSQHNHGLGVNTFLISGRNEGKMGPLQKRVFLPTFLFHIPLLMIVVMATGKVRTEEEVM